jgi:alkylhydroperoxidase family enzyme
LNAPNIAFISPPTKIPFFLRVGLWIARKVSGIDLLPARLLAWYPKAALSSAVLEGLIAHRDRNLDERILKLVRMTVSFTAGCPFCVDMNSARWEKLITPDELAVLQGRKSMEEVHSLTDREKLAIEYAQLASSTPLKFPLSFVVDLNEHFNEREIVILATTSAQVNYWTRLIQALGCPPAGFSGVEMYYLDLDQG